MANPKKEGTFKWNATQIYDNGDVVKWTGKEESAHPAPTTTVKKEQIQMTLILTQVKVIQSLYG
ncbi:hypothetical protein SEVCU144_2206 [Staphylococcus epidermidis VCU144]|nr:hypothetical protein SEVCU144_2206 [Staphylococcus epidermidis VCU144]